MTTVNLPQQPIPTRTRLSRLGVAALTMAVLLLPLPACTRAPLPAPVVMFDEGHGQRFRVEGSGDLDLSLFKKTWQDHGFTVRAASQPLTATTLRGISTLVISGPFTPLAKDEIDAITGFLSQGGQLCVMLHIASPAEGLLYNLGVAISTGVIRVPIPPDGTASSTDFTVGDLAPHPLTKGVQQINLRGAWALNTEQTANVIATTPQEAWIDLNDNAVRDPGDAAQTFAVVVTGQLDHGQFVIFGDDAIFQNRFLSGGNLQLAEALAGWLKEGSYYH